MTWKLRIALSSVLMIGVLAVSAWAQAGRPQDRFIVVLKDGAGMPEDVAADVALRTNGAVGYIYENALQGFSITIPHAALAGLVRDPRIAYVEEDKPVSIFAQTIPTGIDRIFATGNASLGIDGVDDFRVDVDVAVIDTGVDFEHPDLNVVSGVDCTVSSGGGPPWARNYYCSTTEGTGGDDDHYHGTHVAGTIGALDNGIGVVGVAPGARIWAVKVLDSGGSGYESGIVAGIDWIAAQGGIEVANMSLGGSGFSQAEYDAIQGAVETGVAFAVAAGNSDADANKYSPAAFDNVLTVSALADFNGLPGGGAQPTCRTDQDDTLADFSNWGTAVDITAPGVCIRSTYPIEKGEYGTISGTSMASPHVAGALALLASVNGPLDVDDVSALYGQIIAKGNFGWTDDSGDEVLEPLLDVRTFTAKMLDTGAGGITDNPPSVTVTAPASGATVSGTVSVNADADDDKGVTRVEFFVGGASIGVDSVSSDGWSASWDTTAYADGSYIVSAEATDSIGQKASNSVSVTVKKSTSGGGGIELSVNAYKVKGVQFADLTWSGATSTNVDVWRQGVLVDTTANDGAYPDSTGQKGGGSAVYQVCVAGAHTCSNEATAIW
jgi:subtilisin family serine protease